MKSPSSNDSVKFSAQDLYEFDQRAYPASHWSKDDFESELHYGHLLTLLDEKAGLTGLLLFRVLGEVSDLMHLSVLQKRCGQGRKLLESYFQHLMGTCPRVERVMLEVKVDNLAAIALYTSMGFCKLGERLGYYPDGKNALVFEKWLRQK